MKGAFGKKELLAVVPLSWSTIDRLEQAGEFPSRFWITDRRCAWDQGEVEAWLDKRKAAIQAQIVKLVVMELKNVHDTAAKEKILTTYRIPAHVAQHLDFYGDGHWEKDPLEQPNKTKVAEPDLIGEVDEFAEPVAKAPVKKEVSEPILPPPRKEPVKKEEPVAPFVQTVEVVNEVLEVQKALLVTDKESIAKLDRLEKKLDVMIELLQALLNK